MSSHGMILQETGGHVVVSPDIHPEIAAAAIDQHNAVI